jgi:8-oxo-dGTP diphosphatase
VRSPSLRTSLLDRRAFLLIEMERRIVSACSSREYPKTPLVGAAAIVLKQNDSVLLVRRANPPRQGEWSLPGGLQKLGETAVEAACREVREETGLNVRVLDVADIVDLIEWDEPHTRVRYHYTLIDFVACWLGGEPVPGSDAAEVVWAGCAALEPYRLWSETRRVIEVAREKWLAAGAP